MRPGNTLLLLLVISPALLPLASANKSGLNVPSPHKHLPPVDPRIIPICNQTHNPPVCINSARLYAAKYQVIDAAKYQVIDAATVFDMLITALQDRIKVVTARTKAMSESETSDNVRTCIESCLEYYNDAGDYTKEGVDAFVARDVGTFITRLSSAISIISTCNDGFADFSLPNPLEVWNNRLMDMADNCIAVGKMNFKDVF